MDYQSHKLARKMQLEESLEFQRDTFKRDVITYNKYNTEINDLEMKKSILGVYINKTTSNIKSLEADINLLNKEIKEIDDRKEEQFKLVKE